MLQRIITPIDNILNGVTMYRLVLYILIGLTLLSVILGMVGALPFSPLQLVISAAIITAVCFIANILFSKLLKAPTNHESVFITALILFLILLPPYNSKDVAVLAFASVIAIASKFVFAFHKRHLFNPAAISVLILGFLGLGYAVWWIGSAVLVIPTLLGGLLIVRKMRRFTLFLTFLVVALTTMLIFGITRGVTISEALSFALLSYPMFYFGTFMLTEPATTPPTRKLQMIYGTLVGILFGSQFTIGPITSTPELALIVGNIFSYAVSSKEKLYLTLKSKNTLAKDTYEFVFKKDSKFPFIAGQYLEWTLPHVKVDSRGNRRYFTIASSPTEEDIKLGIKFNPDPSNFKAKLSSLKPGDKIEAGQLAGDFTLHDTNNDKLVFVAGGIGITPFRSILSYLLDKGDKKSIILFYMNKTPDEIAYNDILTRAEKELGMKTFNVISEPDKSWKGLTGRLDENIVKNSVPDYKERTFYLSGPNGMVTAYKNLLRKMGVQSGRIRTDYFPGF